MVMQLTRRLGVIVFGIFVLAACAPSQGNLPIPARPDIPVFDPNAPVANSGRSFPLGTGDTIEVTILRHDDLSGVFPIGGDGQIAMALIGNVRVAGRTQDEVEAEIAERYRGDFLRDPNVTVRVIEYRPVAVLGGVNQPGNLAYRPGMTVLAAIAAAGGRSAAALPDKQPLIIRASNTSGTSEFANGTDPVFPGDILEIPARLIR